MEDTHGDSAKEAWSFLRMVNDCATQPLLTVSTSKGHTIKEALVLASQEATCLKYFRVLSLGYLMTGALT